MQFVHSLPKVLVLSVCLGKNLLYRIAVVQVVRPPGLLDGLTHSVWSQSTSVTLSFTFKNECGLIHHRYRSQSLCIQSACLTTLCLSVCVFMSVYVCQSVCQFMCACLSVHVSLSLSVHVCRSVCLSACASVCLCVYVSVCVYVFLLMCRCIRLSMCLCVCLCVSLSVCFALKAIAVVGLQLLWFEKQDPASLLTHILPDTHVSSLSTPAKAKLPHGLRPLAPRGLGGPAALSPTGGRGGEAERERPLQGIRLWQRDKRTRSWSEGV